jgi:hypothetical protein
MTSLQKAAAEAKNSKSSFQTSHGHFENCFASGLDLSEFGGASTTTNNNGEEHPRRESASAQLLRVKEEERRRNHEERDAEEKMQKVVQGRVTNIQETIKKKRDSNVVVNALVQMHGSDTSDPSMFRKNKKLSKKVTSARRHTPSASASTGNKAHKKSRRSKY